MANTYTAGVYPEEWTTALQQRLNKPQNWKEVCDVKFSDIKLFNMPYMSTEFSEQVGTRGTAYSYSDFTISNTQMDIATKYVVPVRIDRADLAQFTLLQAAETGVRQGSILSERIETAVLANHAAWTDVGDASGVITSGVTDQITVADSNIDDIILGVERIIRVANGQELAGMHGKFFVWRPADFEILTKFMAANGFNTADQTLKNGAIPGVHYLGFDHYVSNSHTANHVFAGVKRIQMVGILRSTWGQIVEVPDPQENSAIGMVARLDYGLAVPDAHSTLVYDVNVA